jgi:hypothetical protein
MSTAPATGPATPSKAKLWTGYVLTAIPALMLMFSAGMKLMKPPMVVQGFIDLGYPEHLALPIGILELSVAVLFLIPRTAVLGAILVAAYLGGATATHVRLGQPFIGPVILGILAWIGLYLRVERLTALVPLRK